MYINIFGSTGIIGSKSLEIINNILSRYIFDSKSIYLSNKWNLVKTKLESMLKREKKYDIFMKCMEFIDTRIELDNLGIDKIFDH